MGKAGRVCCIAIPWALTVASLVCLILLEIAGWKNGLLQDLYFMKINTTDISISAANDLSSTTTLTVALEAVSGNLNDTYEIHLWNYCTSDNPDGKIDYCSQRKAEFAFNPIKVWGLDLRSATPTSSSSGAIQSIESELQGTIENEENELLGKSGREALRAYTKASKAMFILYAISFWTTLATLVLGILAIFSRWGSFLTWLFSGISSILTLAAVGLSTGIFIALTEALRPVLKPYNIHTSFGTHAFVVGWLSVAFSFAATFFWLFSVCCCSGKSNPHHRSNKGGLWNAEAKGMGYGDYGRRSLQEKSGGGYERDSSPFLGHARHESGSQVPLNTYPGQPVYAQTVGYEPYRHA